MEDINHKCNICKKIYKNYKSLWKHNYYYHKKTSSKKETKVKKSVIVIQNSILNNDAPKNKVAEDISGYKCKNCDKIYKYRQGLWKHHQICKNKKEKPTINIDDKFKIEKLETELNEIKNMLKSMKIHPKTLQKLNKQLVENTNNGSINNGTINNTTNNIINIIPLGKENLNELLTESQKMDVLKAGNKAHIKLTEIIYKQPELKNLRNVYITNLQNDKGYIYDKKNKQYIVKSKNEIINQYSNERFWNIEEFLETLKDDLDQNEFDKINKLVYEYFNDDKFKKDKKKELLITLYNNKAQVKELYDLLL